MNDRKTAIARAVAALSAETRAAIVALARWRNEAGALGEWTTSRIAMAFVIPPVVIEAVLLEHCRLEAERRLARDPREQASLTRPCPTCGVDVGQRCRVLGGECDSHDERHETRLALVKGGRA